jgi:low affinity Fe/Cu permease
VALQPLARLIRRIALKTPGVVGSPWAFFVAILLVIAWIVTGPIVGFTDSWLLWPSAIASVVTFLIVFSLQYTQNRDTRAIQLKLDEIVRGSEHARTHLVKLERLSDEELAEMEQEIVELREEETSD